MKSAITYLEHQAHQKQVTRTNLIKEFEDTEARVETIREKLEWNGTEIQELADAINLLRSAE